jgi:hypothetical protein
VLGGWDQRNRATAFAGAKRPRWVIEGRFQNLFGIEHQRSATAMFVLMDLPVDVSKDPGPSDLGG